MPLHRTAAADMNRSLDALTSDFKPLAIELIARLVERGVQPLIVQTLRTLEEHRVNLANGTSRTARSKHLPRKMRGFDSGTADDGKADAIDLCPYLVYTLAPGGDKLSWDTATPPARAAWSAIGEVAEMLGLRWGGRWDLKDYGHAELVFVEHDGGRLAAERARPWPLQV